MLSITALLQPQIGLVIFDQAFEPGFQLGGDARAAIGLLARVALVGLAHQHLAHLVVDEVVEQPAGVRQDLAGATDLLLAARPVAAGRGRCVIRRVVAHRNTNDPTRNPPGKPATTPTTTKMMMSPVMLAAIARPSPTIRRSASCVSNSR